MDKACHICTYARTHARAHAQRSAPLKWSCNTCRLRACGCAPCQDHGATPLITNTKPKEDLWICCTRMTHAIAPSGTSINVGTKCMAMRHLCIRINKGGVCMVLPWQTVTVADETNRPVPLLGFRSARVVQGPRRACPCARTAAAGLQTPVYKVHVKQNKQNARTRARTTLRRGSPTASCNEQAESRGCDAYPSRLRRGPASFSGIELGLADARPRTNAWV